MSNHKDYIFDKLTKLRRVIESHILPTVQVGKLFVPVISPHYARKVFAMPGGNSGTIIAQMATQPYELFPYKLVRQRATSRYYLHNIIHPSRKGRNPNESYGPLEWSEFVGQDWIRNYTSTIMFIPRDIELTRQQIEFDYNFLYWGDVSNFDAYADKYATSEEEAWKKALPKKPPPEDPTQSPPL